MKKTILIGSMLSILLNLSCITDSIETEISNEELITSKRRVNPYIIYSEQGICGVTKGNHRMPVSSSEANQLINSFSPLPPIKVTVKYHIVRKSNGLDGIPISDLDLMTTKLNKDFSQALYGCVQFPIGPERLVFKDDGIVNYIDDDEFYIIDEDSDEFDRMIDIYNDKSKLNIYIIKNFEQEPINGLAKIRGNGAAISRRNDAYLGTTVAHEVGHNFGLNHISYNSYQLLCDYKEQNCSSTTGDFIEDTPIYVFTRFGLVNDDCELNQSTSVANICPDGSTVKLGKLDILFGEKNIMKGTTGPCRIGFTGMQHIQMNQMSINLGLGQ